MIVVSILAVITLFLSAYLGFILSKLIRQKKRIALLEKNAQQLAQKRQDQIMESLRVIALAVTQGQCEIAEGVIRIKNLLDLTSLQNHPDLSFIHSQFHRFSKFDYLEERKKLSKRQRYSQDVERFKLEDEIRETCKKCCHKLLDLLKQDAQNSQ